MSLTRALSLIEQIRPIRRMEEGLPEKTPRDWFEENTVPGTVKHG